MKIAQVAPLIESVPPRLYGGTERIVSYLTEELIQLGHQVTLFASGDSVTSAKLVPCAPMALRLDANVLDPIPYYMLMLDRVRELADQFDILHFHIDQFHFPLFRPIADRTVTTLHGRQDLHDLKPLYVGFAICRWSPSLRHNENRSPMRISPQRFITEFPSICSSPTIGRAAIMSLFSAASRRRSGQTAPSQSRGLSGFRSRSPPRSTRSTNPISGRPSPRS